MNSFQIKSDIDMPDGSHSISRITNRGITITVETPCVAVARRVSSYLGDAFDRGARVPVAQVLMAREVCIANYTGMPLVCRMSYEHV